MTQKNLSSHSWLHTAQNSALHHSTEVIMCDMWLLQATPVPRFQPLYREVEAPQCSQPACGGKARDDVLSNVQFMLPRVQKRELGTDFVVAKARTLGTYQLSPSG